MIYIKEVTKMITQNDKQKIEEAKGYPLNVPEYSYIFINKEVYKVTEFNRIEIGESIINDGTNDVSLYALLRKKGILLESVKTPRTPVLAYGANASDIQLSGKYKNFDDVVIPVIRARLVDFDIVFTPYFCHDGSIPATIQYSPGTECEVAITYLTEEQLIHMHKTESVGTDYNYIKLLNIKVELDDSIIDKEVFCYNSLHGSFYTGDNQIAMKCIKAKNRIFQSMSEEELLNMVKNKLGIKKTLDTFILDNINNDLLRKKLSNEIADMSKAFQYNNWVIIGE